MKIRVLSSKDEIENLDENEEMVHLAFRPSNTDIFSIVSKCTNLKALHIPSSYKRTLSESAKMFLDMQGINLLEGDVWGHRKDINEYSEVSDNIYNRIKELKDEGLSDDEIVDKMKKETKLGPDFVEFLIKQKYA
ncbi:Protein of unknown function DUF1699 [Methanohalobium evestigatum Z-7303]|uniref:DUF1699 family protein n=1 Tax=Methanohalobium evestigatum (strain ATCC BAA-1072 / DSM 3721 / NBRC 107634 / OCM 161 / Z-7303) TaxID=644295 RepID=D7E7X4_METEZ|nr:DUF1699 family protein [Methanohalobium evestigatum]ADI73316.1 Protein of unknown function DUF1699 [Methanohalobium evestigatum Z-7303]